MGIQEGAGGEGGSSKNIVRLDLNDHDLLEKGLEFVPLITATDINNATQKTGDINGCGIQHLAREKKKKRP